MEIVTEDINLRDKSLIIILAFEAVAVSIFKRMFDRIELKLYELKQIIPF